MEPDRGKVVHKIMNQIHRWLATSRLPREGIQDQLLSRVHRLRTGGHPRE